MTFVFGLSALTAGMVLLSTFDDAAGYRGLVAGMAALGIGLGLFLVQQIVLAHDGAISYSSAPDQGTPFHVTFALNPTRDPLGVDLIDAI